METRMRSYHGQPMPTAMPARQPSWGIQQPYQMPMQSAMTSAQQMMIQMQSPPTGQFAVNKMVHAHRTIQDTSQQAQMARVMATNPILNNPLVNYSRDKLLLQMKTEEEYDRMKRLSSQIQNSELSEKDLARMVILKPIDMPRRDGTDDERRKQLNATVQRDYDFVTSSWETERDKYHRRRDNRPYKIIIDDPDHREDYKKILYKEMEWKQCGDDRLRPKFDDMVVHRVTDADKEGVDGKHDEIENDRTELDDEHRVIYSKKNRTMHKKAFEYTHIYRYRIKIDEKNQIDLKDSVVEYYENEQKKLEESKKKTDDMLRFMAEEDCLDRELYESGMQKIDEELVDEVDEILAELDIDDSGTRRQKDTSDLDDSDDIAQLYEEEIKRLDREIPSKPISTSSSSGRSRQSQRAKEQEREREREPEREQDKSQDVEVFGGASVGRRSARRSKPISTAETTGRVRKFKVMRDL